MDGFLVQAFGPDDMFMETNPVLVGTEGLIKIGEGDFPIMFVDPGREKGEIKKEPGGVTKGSEQDPQPGYQ
jgi:hypothetical protein